MRKATRSLMERLPLQFRVLYRQFLLRVIDLEALSIQADILRFLGQFAGVLILFSLIQGLGLFIHPEMTRMRLLSLTSHTEQSLISTMMLVAGLVAVISWDNIFPDRRDVMVLSPLPVAPRIILLAKLAATGAVLGLAILALNFAVGVAVGEKLIAVFPHDLDFIFESRFVNAQINQQFSFESGWVDTILLQCCFPLGSVNSLHHSSTQLAVHTLNSLVVHDDGLSSTCNHR
jgi:hypothetical protein